MSFLAFSCLCLAFMFSMGCCCGGCTNRCTGDNPASWQVVVTGTGGLYDGTYIIDTAIDPVSGGTCCAWEAYLGLGGCIEYGRVYTCSDQIAFLLSDTQLFEDGNYVKWFRLITAPYDCTAAINANIQTLQSGCTGAFGSNAAITGL